MFRTVRAGSLIGTIAVSLAAWTLCGAIGRAADSPAEVADQIVASSGVRGGLIVHIGCGDGRLTVALRSGEQFLVHGLATDAATVDNARRNVASAGLYGPVSIDRFDGRHLPYVENLVNLVVAEEPCAVPDEEIQRVLCPGGVACIERGGRWTRTVKPRPEAMDEWTHYMHDAAGNAVSRDTLVGPPEHLQWVGSPAWTRHHDHMSSFNAMVSAGGRVFYIIDEGLRAEIQLPSKWSLVARDAFNGTVLWKRSLGPWQPQLWPAKSGPAQIPRRLVAVGDTVYATLGLGKPATALDAATGRTIRTYDGTEGTEEILVSDGVLFMLVNPEPTALPWSTKPDYAGFDDLRTEPDAWSWHETPRLIVAAEAETGKVLWKARSPVAPLTLAVGDTRVFFHDGQKVVCLDRATGRERWRSKPIPRAQDIRCWFAPTLVAYQDVVLFAGAENMRRHFGGKDTMTALSADTGEILWTAEHPPSGYDSPEDLLVVDGLVWTAPTTNRRDSGEFTGRDVHTGEVERTFASDCGDHMPHHRCHRAKATEKYILASRTGIEYVDLTAEHWNRNDWIRGACMYGIMPANGLTYAPPQSCACYILAKLNGLNAVAPATPSRQLPAEIPAAGRLEKGPAYTPLPSPASGRGAGGEGVASQPSFETGEPAGVSTRPHPAAAPPPSPGEGASKMAPSADWPTYRHDAGRSGWTAASVPAKLKRAWETQLGGRLTSPVIAGGKVLVASIDRHTVYALAERTGEVLWQTTAGGRVDSPPTVFTFVVPPSGGIGMPGSPQDNQRPPEGGTTKRLCLFGSADGYVYAVRLDDGVLAWRFRAAPVDQRLTAFEQLESVWPVHGSVLVLDGVVHCVAGRSMFLDGGMRYLRLDAAGGRLLSETVLDNRNPDTGQPLDAEVKWPNLPVALPDVLSSDGRSVYMRSQAFDLEGRRREIVAPSDFKDQGGPDAHLFSLTGFLDDSWWHRTYWLWGKTALGGAGGWYLAAYRAPTGRIMVCDASRVYSFDRRAQYYPRSTALEYHLFAAAKEPEIVGGKSSAPTRRNRPAPSRPVYDWSFQVPLLARAMVLADRTLFAAGPPDVADEEETLTAWDDPDTSARLAEQAAGLEGRRGSVLVAVSADDGTKRAAYRLDAMPVFDGLAAADGRLVMATTDGKVLSLAAEGKPLPAADDVELTEPPQPADARGRAAVALTESHPDFQSLTDVQLAASDLGYRLAAPGGRVGLALKKLDKPLARQATFKLTLIMRPLNASKQPPGNGFLVFGDAADDAHLVKCGLRNAGQAAMIVQGPLGSGKSASRKVVSRTDTPIELTVDVDLDGQTVTMNVLGETIETPLARKLDAISYVGYCVTTVTSEFSPIEITGR